MTTASNELAARAETDSLASASAGSSPADLHDGVDDTRLVQPAATQVIAAWLMLVGAGAALRLGGFSFLQRVVRRWPVRARSRGAGQDAVILQTRAALRRAATYYFSQTWCLQRSAALVFLLRAQGVSAHVVIGVQKLPFHAHAWVEVGTEILNGPSTLRTRMMVIDRW